MIRSKNASAPVLNVRAYPSGMVKQESFDHLTDLLVRRIECALPANGILLDLHGAMVTQEHEDAEAEIARAVREAVGPDIPIVVTLDLHANIRRVPVTHRLQLRNQLIAGLVFIPQALPSAASLETGGPRLGSGHKAPLQSARTLRVLTRKMEGRSRGHGRDNVFH